MDYYLTDQLTDDQATALGAFVEASAHGHLQQHPAWVWVSGRTRRRQYLYFWGEQDGAISVSALIRNMRLPRVGWSLDSVERGPVCDDASLLLDATDRLAGRLRAWGSASLTVNPYWTQPDAALIEAELAQRGFAVVDRDAAPHSHSLIIDLSQSEEEILASLRKSTRKAMRRSEQLGVTVRPARDEGDAEAFWRLYQHAARHKTLQPMEHGFAMRLWRRFLSDPRYGRLVLAHHENRLISADVTLRHGPSAEATYGPSRMDILLDVPKSHLCFWEAIKWAKSCGCAVFDLGGYEPDAPPESPLASINEFKLGYSKTAIQLVREHRQISRPSVHRLLTWLHQTRGLIRTVSD
jgi:hypothetical protein